MRAFLVAVLMLFASAASAQMIQSGPVTKGHGVVAIQGGAPGAAIYGDSGSALDGKFTELGITNTGTPFDINDAARTGPYHALVLGANALGGGLLSYDSYGGASPLPLKICKDGACVEFPFTTPGTGVMGPSTSTVGEIASWGNTVGTLLRQGPATITDNKTGAITTDSSAFQGASRAGITAAQIYGMTTAFRPLFTYDTVRAVTEATAGSGGGLINVNGVASYLLNDMAAFSGIQNATAFFGVTANGTPGSFSWGINTVSTDTTVSEISGVAGMQVKGAEFNLNINRPDTTGWGIGLVGASFVQPTGFFPGIWIGGLGTGIKWSNSIEIADGVSRDRALYIGAASSPCSTGCNGSLVSFGYNKASDGVHEEYNLMVDAFNAFNVLGPSSPSITNVLNVGGGTSPVSFIASGNSMGTGGGGNFFVKNGGTIVGGIGNSSINGEIAYSLDFQIFSGPGPMLFSSSTAGFIFQDGLVQGTPTAYACFDASNHLVRSVSAC